MGRHEKKSLKTSTLTIHYVRVSQVKQHLPHARQKVVWEAGVAQQKLSHRVFHCCPGQLAHVVQESVICSNRLLHIIRAQVSNEQCSRQIHLKVRRPNQTNAHMTVWQDRRGTAKNVIIQVIHVKLRADCCGLLVGSTEVRSLELDSQR